MKDTIGDSATILVVDDDRELLEVIREELSEFFFEVVAVNSGRSALEYMKTHRVDCVVTDYRMPEMNGLELIRALGLSYPSLPIILVTGNGSDEEVVRALSEGLFDYLDKPFKSPVLVNRIRNALLLPRLESLMLDLLKSELSPEMSRHYREASPSEKLKMFSAMEALVRTRILAKERKKAS